MGFDPAFYYHQPINAAHSHGPVLLAGTKVINLLKKTFEINDSSLQLTEKH